MNRLREFIGSFRGLAPMRQKQGLGWVISAFAGFAILFGVRGSAADTECPYTWTVCSAGSDCASAEGMYRYCTYGLDAYCNFYTVDCWNSSTPCSEADQGIAPAVLTRKVDCDNDNRWCGAGRNSTKPYRYCINYYKANGDVFGPKHVSVPPPPVQRPSRRPRPRSQGRPMLASIKRLSAITAGARGGTRPSRTDIALITITQKATFFGDNASALPPLVRRPSRIR